MIDGNGKPEKRNHEAESVIVNHDPSAERYIIIIENGKIVNIDKLPSGIIEKVKRHVTNSTLVSKPARHQL